MAQGAELRGIVRSAKAKLAAMEQDAIRQCDHYAATISPNWFKLTNAAARKRAVERLKTLPHVLFIEDHTESAANALVESVVAGVHEDRVMVASLLSFCARRSGLSGTHTILTSTFTNHALERVVQRFRASVAERQRLILFDGHMALREIIFRDLLKSDGSREAIDGMFAAVGARPLYLPALGGLAVANFDPARRAADIITVLDPNLLRDDQVRVRDLFRVGVPPLSELWVEQSASAKRLNDLKSEWEAAR